jgi:tetratricopeptide (TPR) repeat protein
VRVIILLLLVVASPITAADPKQGEIFVSIKAAEVKPNKGAATPLTAGTCVTVLEVDGRVPLYTVISSGKVGRVDATSLIPQAEAHGHFTNRIEADAKDAGAWLARGKVSFVKGDLDNAVADLDESLKLKALSEARAVRGFAWKRKGDKDKALADFDEAIRLDPKNGLAWRVRGATYAGKAEYAKALADYTEAINVDPENPDALHHRVNLLSACNDEKIRNGKQAVADATKACELTEFKVPMYLVGLGAAYAEAGDFDAAIKWHTKAMEGSKVVGKDRLGLYERKQPFRMTWR